jgi:transcriptional regulator with XRE-family HTH domain
MLDDERNTVNVEFDVIVGDNIRRLRLKRGLSQASLAERANIDVTRLSRVENGQRRLSFREAMAICDTLHVRPTRLASASQAHS